MVVMRLAPTEPTGVMHERIAAPPMSTVQAPQTPRPQPYFVPRSWSVSRSAHSSGISDATEIERD